MKDTKENVSKTGAQCILKQEERLIDLGHMLVQDLETYTATQKRAHTLLKQEAWLQAKNQNSKKF